MATKQVVIVGMMTYDEGPVQPPSGAHPEHPIFYPPHIWGPPDPRPSNPIANVPGISNPNPPGFGARPEHPIYYPPGIWGPTDPRPTPPIYWPGFPGSGGGGGEQPPSGGGGGQYPPGDQLPTPPDDSNPAYIIRWNPKYGWVLIPLPGAEDKPHPDQTLPGDLPPDSGYENPDEDKKRKNR